MRRAVVLAMLLSCGKTGDRGLEAAARTNTLEIRDGDLQIELDRHAAAHVFAVRPLNCHLPDCEFTDPDFVEEEVVDRWLGAIARGDIATNAKGARVFVTLHPIGAPEPMRLALTGKEEPYAALTSRVRRELP